MLQGVDARLLIKLDRLISRYKLHEADVYEPVDLGPLLESFNSLWQPLPHGVQAYTARWAGRRRRHVEMVYSHRLRAPDSTAEKRHAQAHELAHILCDHSGDVFVMRPPTGDREQGRFDKWVNSRQENQCEAVAAYLLVRWQALLVMREQTNSYIATTIDVPVELVDLRWAIWRKFGR
jgi:hypothetical protein